MNTLTRARKLVPTNPPPGPFRPGFWRSPLRGPWLTSFLGTLLVPGIVLMLLTGLISQWSYYPTLGRNATTPVADSIPPLFHLPVSWPSWDYAVTQGIHVNLGLALVPLVLAKLWSVIPRLFKWPAVESPAAAVERLSLLVLVSSVLVEFFTGVADAEYWYPWHFSFYTIHYYGAWVFFSAFALHFAIKLPTVRRAYRTRGLLKPLRDDLKHTRPEPPDPDGLVAARPDAPTISRRGLLAMVGGGSLAVLLVNVGETIGGPLRRTALLGARGRVFGTGPNDFQITTTAVSAGVTGAVTGTAWRLSLAYDTHIVSLSRAQLMAMPQHHATLTLTCVEGWSTTQHWTGVRLADLRDLVGAKATDVLKVSSIQPSGPFRHVALAPQQVAASDALLALCVNGVDLSPDHGYPARVIVPGAPGVHNTKWVGSMRFVPA
ncbi:MAG TPA: molybdopterin-dependent oxidoreductase [Solirubrobacteraceae bacterium]|nr:molybdopterin-dependent oxidoreductase [Solirubrobacteraceae bacterium]